MAAVLSTNDFPQRLSWRASPESIALMAAPSVVEHEEGIQIGLINIREGWTVAVSLTLSDERSEFWAWPIDAYEGQAITLPDKFNPSREYLAHHRAHIFQQ